MINDIYQKTGRAFVLALKKLSDEEILQLVKDAARIRNAAAREYDARVEAEINAMLEKAGIFLDNPYHPKNRGFDGPTGAE